MIAGTGALRKLREAYPQAHIVLLGDKITLQVCPAGTLADEVLDIDSFPRSVRGFFSLLGYIRREKFDIAVNMRWKSDLTAVLTVFSGARKKLGGGSGFYTLFYHGYEKKRFSDQNRHEYLIHTDILAPLGVNGDNIRTYIHRTPADERWAAAFMRKHGLKRRSFLLVAPIASNAQKSWKAERFAEIAARFRRTLRAPLVMTYSPGDAEKAETIVRAAKVPGIYLTGKTEIGQIAALAAAARLVLCNNSGIIHIAYAVDTPVFCLNTSLGWMPFGTRDVAITRLPPDRPVEENRFLSNDEVEKLLSTITVDEVWTLLKKQWQAVGRARAR